MDLAQQTDVGRLAQERAQVNALPTVPAPLPIPASRAMGQTQAASLAGTGLASPLTETGRTGGESVSTDGLFSWAGTTVWLRDGAGRLAECDYAAPPFGPAGVWGWPWHGLWSQATGKINGSKPMSGVVHGASWLIDAGLPAVTRTPAEASEDAAHGYTWRNYALVAGGTVYGTELPADSWIYMDSGGVPLLVSLVNGTLNDTGVTFSLSVRPFGRFRMGQTAAVAAVTLGPYTLSYSTDLSYGPYTNPSSTFHELQDVKTNGVKALIGVVWRIYPYSDDLSRASYNLVAVNEITLSGAWGADGGGLSASASIIRDGTACYDKLTTSLRHLETIYARYAYYDSGGDARVARLRTYDYISDDGLTFIDGVYLLEDATQKDWLEMVSVNPDPGVWSGSLSSHFAPQDRFVYWTGSPLNWKDSRDLLARIWMDSTDSGTVPMLIYDSGVGGTVYTNNALGLQRIDAHAAALFIPGTPRTYGSVMTPTGVLTAGLSPSGNIYFAWQRKTGATQFSTSRICYV